MSPDMNPFGVMLHNGSIVANTEYNQNFKMTLGSGWDQDNISVILAVYKKECTKYAFVNSAKATLGTTSIDATNNNLTKVNLYPNPTTNAGSNLEISLVKSNELTINVYDIAGKKVYSTTPHQYEAGQNNLYIPTSNLSAGYYNVSITSQDIKHNKVLIVK